ncbi:MAG TPA: MBL fold metallo-hydrolase [Candidatus Limnocylindrales bacterium]|nr:MBL fold metallo-hydrolase [Candidatus Limnocylindrales bacterium]
MHARWDELAPGVQVGRFAFLDQSIGLVVGDGASAIVDTRGSKRFGVELADDVRALGVPPVEVVVDTHHHWDHAYGNAAFPGAEIWGHARVEAGFRREAARHQALLEEYPEMVDQWDDLVVVPPTRVFEETAYVDVGGRRLELRHLGRGHTDDDVVVIDRESGVAFAGDLVENGAPPYFGDGYPLDWPETVARLLDHLRETVVPGHGEPAGRSFVEDQLTALLSIADLARRVARGHLDPDTAVRESPFGDCEATRVAVARGVAQIRGELDRG